MANTRKYLVFWGVLLVFVLLIAAAVFVPRFRQNQLEQTLTEGQTFALSIEASYPGIDVVNIRTYTTQEQNTVLSLYFEVLEPVPSETLQAMSLDMFRGLHSMSTGGEDFYALQYLFGSWLVARTVCPATEVASIEGDASQCDFVDVTPPEFVGPLVIWPKEIQQ